MRGRSLLLLCALLLPATAGAVEFTIRGTRFRLDITDSLFAGYHNFSELPQLPAGSPLNPFSGIDRLFDSGGNYLPLDRTGLTRTGAGQAGQGYADLFNRLNLSLSFWRITAGLRIDTALFLHAPASYDFDHPDLGGCARACESRFLNKPVSPTGLEKIYVNYTDRRWDLTLGDSYTVFGRGLLLSVRKVDELGIDTTLLGGKAVYNSGKWKLIGLAGVSNIQNIDEATGRFQADPFDLVLGARGEARVRRRLLVGVHAAGGLLAGGDSGYQDGRLGYGATVEAPRLLPWLDLYLEGAGLQLFKGKDAGSSGFALYGSATAYAGPLSILFEGKAYHHFDPWYASTQQPEFRILSYNLPPTAELLLTELEDPQAEIYGGRLTFDYRVNSWLALVASDGMFRQDKYQPVVLHPADIRDVYGGVQLRWHEGVSHLFANGGYRREYDFEAEEDFKRTGWFDWDFVQALPRRLSVESQGRVLLRHRAREPDWTEGNAYVALKWTPYLVGAAGLEWSTRQQVVSEFGKEYAEYAYYPSGFVQYNITTRSSVRLFAGGQRGGLKCVSGICRVYPEFRGARLEVVLRF